MPLHKQINIAGILATERIPAILFLQKSLSLKDSCRNSPYEIKEKQCFLKKKLLHFGYFSISVKYKVILYTPHSFLCKPF